MKSQFLSEVALFVALITLAGCTSATNNTPTSTVPNPTTATLAGSWAMTKSYTGSSGGNPGSFVETTTLTYAADGTYLSSVVTVFTPTATGAVTTTYGQSKGTFSIVDDQLTLTKTQERFSSAPFADTTTGWGNQPSKVTTAAAIRDGKLYYPGGPNNTASLFTAQGTTAGVVGTWGQTQFRSTDTKPYSKTVFILKADLTATQESYSSNTATFLNAPDNPASTGTYALSGANQITFTPLGGSMSTDYYSSFGQYLVFGSDATLSAYTKQ